MALGRIGSMVKIGVGYIVLVSLIAFCLKSCQDFLKGSTKDAARAVQSDLSPARAEKTQAEKDRDMLCAAANGPTKAAMNCSDTAEFVSRPAN